MGSFDFNFGEDPPHEIRFKVIDKDSGLSNDDLGECSFDLSALWPVAGTAAAATSGNGVHTLPVRLGEADAKGELTIEIYAGRTGVPTVRPKKKKAHLLVLLPWVLTMPTTGVRRTKWSQTFGSLLDLPSPWRKDIDCYFLTERHER